MKASINSNIAMNNFSTSVETLYNLSFNKLCHSMNEDILRKIFKDYPSSIIFKVIWKVLRIDNENKKFVHGRTIQYTEPSVFDTNSTLTHMISNDYYLDYFGKINMIHTSTEDQQMMFCNKFKFSNHFDLELFFKLVKNCQFRCKLFVIFQICVQEKGLEFPKQFAKGWIESNTQDNEMKLCLIEHGLLLGIFLGDSGWYSESAFVLSYIYKIISTKWTYSDQNLKLTQSIQCLTKWLSVVTIYHDFDEAKVILSHILSNIKHLEQIKESRLYLINAYVSVSQYYYVLFDYNEAWLWTVKAIDELDDECSDVLRLLVMSHCVKICSVTNRLSMAKKIIQELYTYNKEIDPNVWIDVMMNIAYYSLNANLSKYNMSNYFTALDSCIHLFGYINLHTANILIENANARFGANYSETDFTHALSNINQGICIMHTIGVPDNNMSLINAQIIKSFILQQLFIIRIPSPQSIRSIIPTLERLRINIENLESWHWKAIEVSSKSFGVKALIIARLYYNLGRFYQNQERLMNYKLMQLTLFAIGGSMEYLENPEVQLCQRYLSDMHKTQREKVHKAEQFYLQTKSIYETTYGSEYFRLLHVYQRLSEVYDTQKDSPKYITCLEKIWIFKAQMKEILHHQMPIMNKNNMKSCISLEQLKYIVNGRE